MDMSNHTCGTTTEIVSYVYPIILHFCSILLTSRALQIQFRLREMFHPFFSLLLFLVLLSYNLSNVVAIIGTVMVMCGASEDVVHIGNFFYYFFYFYINGMMFCLVVERLVATIFMKTYEYNRKWWPVTLSQPVAVGLAILNLFMQNVNSRVISIMTLYLLNIVCLIILLAVNYRITRALAGTGATLTTRYQITENIRTIRVLLPTVVCDALVSAVDVSGMLLFGLQHIFQTARCTENDYIFAFHSFTSASAIFEFLVPLSLLLSHPAYRRHSLLLPEKQPPIRIQQSVIKDKTLPKVVNVLGIEIANANEQAYFENLSKAWNLRL
ncbi:Sre G protein-coupled chemoreceptor [Trichostrongylus colubriformis]|uniref:Sre G protein-coupled chemoreceptor n=1 Tax=Trichostrongylus colubriformis TaxID=6319 RepID=A0AAN8G3N3_TRICO